MAFVGIKEMLIRAQEGGYAVGAFNVENMEMAMAVVRAAEQMRAPVILQTTPSTLKYAPPEVFAAMVRALAEASRAPVAMHLDHGSSRDLAAQCMAAGYSAIMIDGSMLPFEDNITVTRKVVQDAHAKGIPVEAELGKVGGKEDDLEADADAYTDPDEAAVFVERTGVDALAVGIGTAHGFYVGTPILDKQRLSLIRERVSVPLVLHGASGLSVEDVRDCIGRGICKVNFATELRAAYTKAAREVLVADPKLYDPKKFGGPAMARTAQLVAEKIRVCGSEGKA